MDFQKSIPPILQEAGDLALEYFSHLQDLEIELKGPKDFVTEADKAVESFLKRKLKELAPEYGFFGEEEGIEGNQKQRWIIDPIDGTHSFMRGQYFWGISLGLEVDGTLTEGFVLAPALRDLFQAKRGFGAFKNSKPISVSKISKISEAMVATGFACLRAGLEENNLQRFNRIALETAGQRRFGSAALDLCMVADGQVEAYFEQELNLYDIAAGIVILREAGGDVYDFKGVECVNPKEVLATNKLVDQQLFSLI
ncbi:MAG: inositol monophosphatase family protein [SAR324 cluster bacterium]|nr:inositol monophosphatase family protein [SAR324 cluster bacterium]